MRSQPYVLRDEDLAQQLRAHGIRAAPDSPLRTLSLRPPTSPSQTKLPLESDLRKAITAIARPGIELGILLSPPHSLGALWFYRTNETDLIGYLRDAVGNHIFVVTSDRELGEHVRSCLQLETMTTSRELSVTLSRQAFVALAGLVDHNREWSLRSLLDRMPTLSREFHPADTMASLHRSVDSGDWRWFGGLMQAMCPFELSISKTQCEAAFLELEDAGLLKKATHGWLATPAMQYLFATLASPVAYCAIHGRRHCDDGWQSNHVAAFRGLGVMWLLQFVGGRIKISNANSAQLDLVLARSLFEWVKDAPPPPELAPDPVLRPSATIIMVDPADELAAPDETIKTLDDKYVSPADTKPPATVRIGDDGDETLDDMRCEACGQLVEGGLKCPNCGARLR